MKEQSTKDKLLSGVLWNFIEKVSIKSSSFIISIVLARLLSPSDYGLLGMLGVFIAVSNIFIESGFAKALIQKKDCEDIDYSTAFVTNVVISFIIYIVLFVTAPFISDFYDEPSLTLITRVLSLNFVLGSFNIVQRAKLMSAMNFKALAKVNFIGTIIGGCTGICAAYLGWGVWALLTQTITNTIAIMCLLPIYSKWTPSLKFSKLSFNHLFSFGSKLLITGVVATIVNNITTIAIGKYYKSNELGYYTRAAQFSELIAWTLNDVLGTVTFPVLSDLQNDTERMVHIYSRSLYYTAMLIFPVMALMALLAKPLVILLLTEKWLPCVFMLQILCLARMFTPLSAINMNILNAVGRPDLFMKLDLSKLPLDIITLVITIPMGMKAIVIGSLIKTFICFFMNAYLPGRMFGYGAIAQLKDWRYIILSVILMSIVTYLTSNIFDNSWCQLLLGGIAGVSIYLLCCIRFNMIDKQMIVKILRRK